MRSIAMSQSCGRASVERSIARVEVEHHRAIDDFVATILIHVGNGKIVVALSIPSAVVVAVPCVAHFI